MKDKKQKIEKMEYWGVGVLGEKLLLHYFFTPFLLCFIFLTFLIGCATTQIDEEGEAVFHYKMGVSYMNEGNIQMAFVQFQKAYQLNPNNKEVLNSLGLVYFQLDEFEKAKEFYLKAVYVDPNFSEAYNNLGVLYISTKQFPDAVDSLKRALSNPLYQTPERAFYNLGIAYYRTGQFDLSINAYKDAIKRSPSFPLPYYGLALVYNKIGKYGDASLVITKAIEIDPAYRGDRNRFAEDIKKRIVTTKGDDEIDLRDYLEILNY